MGKSYGDTILLGDLTTVGAALGSCNSELSVTTGLFQVTVKAGRSGSVPLFTSGGHVMDGGWLSLKEINIKVTITPDK